MPIAFILLVIVLLCEIGSRVLAQFKDSRKGSKTNQVSAQNNIARDENPVADQPDKIIENEVQSKVETVSERIVQRNLENYVELTISKENETFSRREQDKCRNELALAVPSTSTSKFFTMPRFNEDVELRGSTEISPKATLIRVQPKPTEKPHTAEQTILNEDTSTIPEFHLPNVIYCITNKSFLQL